MEKLSKKNLLLISLMLFSMFFGAGNLIFPPLLGQLSGTNVVFSLGGFLLSAVGLPILAVATVAKGNGLQSVASRVNKTFAIVFSVIIYLSIGPFLGIPRAGSLAFEMGVKPFLSENIMDSSLPLFIYTLSYFSLAFWLSIKPSKLVDRLGKILTPAILLLIALIFFGSIIKPIGSISTPSMVYEHSPILKGFLDGYMTMDAIAALNFGIVIAFALKEKGVQSEKGLVTNTIKAGIIAGLVLTVIYIILSYLGACAETSLGSVENGAESLTNIVLYLFGSKGIIILGLIFSLACLSTSVGLITSCSQYFATLTSKISYRCWTTILCVSSMVFANVGLNNILKFSVPVLDIIYPMAIVIIILPFFHKLFKGYSCVYKFTMATTALFSILSALEKFNIKTPFLHLIPWADKGLVWVLPALVAALLGYIYGSMKENAILKR